MMKNDSQLAAFDLKWIKCRQSVFVGSVTLLQKKCNAFDTFGFTFTIVFSFVSDNSNALFTELFLSSVSLITPCKKLCQTTAYFPNNGMIQFIPGQVKSAQFLFCLPATFQFSLSGSIKFFSPNSYVHLLNVDINGDQLISGAIAIFLIHYLECFCSRGNFIRIHV